MYLILSYLRRETDERKAATAKRRGEEGGEEGAGAIGKDDDEEDSDAEEEKEKEKEKVCVCNSKALFIILHKSDFGPELNLINFLNSNSKRILGT